MKDLELNWRRSTRCEAGFCIEVAGPWIKSSRSGTGGCVEARRPVADTVLVRDSKLGRSSPVLSFGAQAWTAFVDGLKGEGS